MKIGIITGSHRKEAQSKRVGLFIEAELKKQGAETFFFALSENPLPLWDEGVWAGAPEWQEKWTPIAKEFQACDGFVVVSPEWAGMVPSGLKNLFLLTSPREVGHKPGLIVAVSSGLGGSYPVAELRQSSYKNCRICYLPEHVIVRNVESMLKNETATDAHDISLRKRIAATCKILIGYSNALKTVREGTGWDYKEFPFGM